MHSLSYMNLISNHRLSALASFYIDVLRLKPSILTSVVCSHGRKLVPRLAMRRALNTKIWISRENDDTIQWEGDQAIPCPSIGGACPAPVLACAKRSGRRREEPQNRSPRGLRVDARYSSFPCDDLLRGTEVADTAPTDQI